MCSASGSPAPFPKPGSTLNTPAGIPASIANSAIRIAVSGDFSDGFSTTRIAHGQRRRDLPRRHQQREIPRHDRADHAQRLARDQAEFVADRSARLRHRPCRSPRRSSSCSGRSRPRRRRSASLDRLAHVQRFEQGQFVAVLLDQLREPDQHALPMRRLALGPAPANRKPRRATAHRAFDVLGFALGDTAPAPAHRSD